MGTAIAMAGLAEAGEAFALIMVAGMLTLAAGLIALGWWKSLWGAAAAGCIACLLVGLVMQPWNAFKGPQLPNDSDEVYWLARERFVDGVWVVIFLSAFYTLVVVVRRRMVRRPIEKTN